MQARNTLAGTIATIAALTTAAFVVPLGAQTPAKPAARTPAATKTFVASKTPWGDPDIQGTWSTDDLRGVPVQRPDEFAGRAELSDEEFAGQYAGWNAALRGALGAARAVERMVSYGSTAPAEVTGQIAAWRARLGTSRGG